MENKKVKIIWHFKKSAESQYIDKAEEKIKKFYNDSLIVFDCDLDIIILNDE